MAKVKYNLTGQRFGELIALEYLGNSKWQCKCDCGKICVKNASHLIGGYTKTCGHKNGSTSLKDMTGERFGKLTVIKYSQNSHWECLCDCGNTIIVRGWELRNNKKTSCGKCEYNKRLDDLTGRTIGHWHVEEYVGNKKWKCTCELCGRSFEVYSNNLKNGTSNSCIDCANNIKIKPRREVKIGSIDKYLDKGYYECTCGGCGRKIKRHGTIIDRSDTILCKHCSPLRLIKDMSGKVINNWTVIKYLGTQRWLCKCNLCNKESIVFGYNLRSGHSNSCGCQLRKDITGNKIGEWTVIEYVGNYYYKCKCSCGTVRNVLSYSLRTGESKSCGCKKWEETKSALLQRYNEIAPSKINNMTRNVEQITILNTKELFTSYIINLGYKPTVYELCNKFGVGTSTILRHIHKYEIENIVDIDTRHSKQELDVLEILNGIFEDNEIILCDRSVLNGKELDIYIPKAKLAFEINGSYWHSSVFKSNEYHFNKTQQCAKYGIHLVHLFEYEWNDNETKSKLINYILNICDNNSNIQINARDCEVREVNQSLYELFCDQYHLQGPANAPIIYGLYNNNELLQLMSFGRPRFNKNYQYELIRLCIKDGYRITGGSERLFKHFINEYNPTSVISYCDIAKFTGAVYDRLGFNLKEYSEPGYVWVEPSNNTIMKRYQTQKHKLLELGLGTEEQTENEIMESIGFLKIYNCGNAVYTWTR